MKAENVAEDILNQRKGEDNHHALHLAIARADAAVKGLKQTVFWLYNEEYDAKHGNYKQQRYNRNENVNCCVAKNSPLGGQIIKRQSGKYKSPKGSIDFKFISLS